MDEMTRRAARDTACAIVENSDEYEDQPELLNLARAFLDLSHEHRKCDDSGE